jgi:type VI secretion system protein ImpC
MSSSFQRDLENLPLYIYQEDGESMTKPCAEAVLTETVAEELIEQGLMPLISFRDSGRVRLPRFQSVSAFSNRLGGRWEH